MKCYQKCIGVSVISKEIECADRIFYGTGI